MPLDWDRQLAEWSLAGVVDVETAERIRRYEHAQASGQGTRWSVWLALIFGVALLGAGVLLLVSAIWDNVPPLARLALVVAMVAFFHLAAAVAGRWSGRSAAALHLAGTAALGPAIFMGGAVLNLDSHWPAGVMLWAVGAGGAWLVRRDIGHFGLVALLVPAWLLCEWGAMAEFHDVRASIVPQAAAFLVALAYVTTARTVPARGPSPTRPPDLLFGLLTPRRALWWLGLASFPLAALFLGIQAGNRIGANPWWANLPPLPPVSGLVTTVGWTIAIAAPLAVAFLLRGRGAWVNVVAAAWVVCLALLPTGGTRMFFYGWLALGCLGLAAWGIRETSGDRINLATLCFGLVVLFFYFDNVMDKMGRAASLIGLGLLFLAGGYALERVRRRMLARAGGGVS